MITFHSHRSDTIIGKLIRFFSRGNNNHISIEYRQYVYEAVEGKWVIKTHIADWCRETVVDSIQIQIKNKDVITFLEKQVGKKYDYFGVVSFIFSLLRPREWYWFCSELAMVILVKSQGMSGSDFDNQKVSPHLFWGILKLMS